MGRAALQRLAAELRDFDAAIRSQQAAIDEASAAGRPEAVAHMRTILEGYRQRRLCRASWRANDPVHSPRPAP